MCPRLPAFLTPKPGSARPAIASKRQFVPPPVFRKLPVFAVDPGMTARFETAVINEQTVQIP